MQRITKALLLSLCLTITGISLAQSNEVKDRLFSGAYLAQQAAKNNQAGFLAPDTFADGNKALAAAEKAYSKRKSVEKVREQLVEAISDYESSSVVVARAMEDLATALASRRAALGINAHKFSPKDWEDAEELMEKAIEASEKEKKSKAKSLQEKAAALYRDVELVAIKAEYLDETRRLIAKAEDAKIGKYAPITLRRAQELLATAEVELTENRYDVDLPRSYAKQARYEAKHAFYLAHKIRQNRDNDLTDEQLLLASEVPMQKVAAAADINAQFDEGLDPVAQTMVEYVERSNATLQETKQQLADRGIQIAGMNELLSEFARLHGGSDASSFDLEKYLAMQAELQRRVQKLETLFDRTEARVFRELREVYIRLVGLSFDSGSSRVESSNYDLLNKVSEGLRMYPNSKVIVEGHTDSFGGDDSNLILSKNRAQAVRRYLIDYAGLAESQVEAQGFGETKPFANNDTPQGRALNRRIDVKILPASL